MKIVFADTSFYVATLNPRDVKHARAEVAGRSIRGRVVTTEYVLLEVATFFCEAPNRAVFLDLLLALQNDPEVTILPASGDLWKRGIALFAARPDKDWSLTDCISFVVMQERKIQDALTAGHHFEQTGLLDPLK